MDESENKIFRDGFKNNDNYETVAKKINDYRQQKGAGKCFIVQSPGGIPYRYSELGLISKEKAKQEHSNFKKQQNKMRKKERTNSNNKSWYKQRKLALERDLNKCKICESTEKLHVHHITPFKKSKSHEINNLITLCGQCHVIVGKNKLWISAHWVDYSPKKVFHNIISKYLHIVSGMGYEVAVGKGSSSYNGPFLVWKVGEKGTLDIKYDEKLEKK
ncbi:HNH endonuclease [Methanococcoides sp. NM1]|uniref:HNH endonuclease n=1 Tax=Methanococcoides sp. NM1 TaxID=1201013 RepID=UPI0010838931|nr:HNH endonuclease signature motif containing protein [Methanococcoides sp. NM1]